LIRWRYTRKHLSRKRKANEAYQQINHTKNN